MHGFEGATRSKKGPTACQPTNHLPAFFSTRLPSSSTHLSPTTASSSMVTERSRQDWPMVTLRPMVVDAGRPVGTELHARGVGGEG